MRGSSFDILGVLKRWVKPVSILPKIFVDFAGYLKCENGNVRMKVVKYQLPPPH